MDAETAVITDETDVEAVDQRESSPDMRRSSDHPSSSSNLAASRADGDAAAESDCRLADTVAKSSTTTSVSHATSHAGDHEMQSSPAVVCIDSEIASPAAVCSPEQVHATTSSPVIDVDGDDDVIVAERKSGASKKVKQRLIDAWHSQTDGALKSAVNRAVAHLSASRGPDATSPVSVNCDVLPSVAVTSPAVTTSGTRVPPQTSHTGSQSQVARRADAAVSRASDATLPQSDVPTARVIGRVVSIRRPSPMDPSTAHQTTTTATRCLNVVSTSVVAASAAASVTPAAAARMPVAAASWSSSLNVSAAAKSRGSVSGRSMRGGGARRPRRPRRVTRLCAEDLYEISSQIVTEMLQRNKQQSSEMDDVITCEDDDGDDEGIVDVDVDGQSGHFCDDVMIIDDDHGANPVRTIHHPRAPRPTSSKTTAGSCSGVAAAAVRTWKKLLIPSLSQVVAPSHCQRVDASDDVTVLGVASQVAEDANEFDVVCCDEDTRDAGPRRLTAAVPAPRSEVTASAGDDDILICDTPAPSETEACTSNTRRLVRQTGHVPGGCLGRRSTAVSSTVTQGGREKSPAADVAATLPCPCIPADDDDDDVVLVDASNPSSSETSQGDTLQCSSSSSVIILD